MSANPNIPELFREIFRGAYLPFNNPATLDMFLKSVNEIEYTHSEDLGDAFEHLLSVMGAQGDAGQFRTPRHIIDFIVAAVDPQKGQRVLDPACGTAGFLVSAYRHILKANTRPGSDDMGGALAPDERARLTDDFCGYDISSDMARLSRVNLYLHLFPDPKIYEYDTLTSLERWDEMYDCILTNPPFMSPRGGIQPHSRFSIPSKRSEVLFVDYILDHLTPDGRAGIIVPEGVIFQSQNAHKALRKKLVEENYLYAVVSLPAGVFQPYSGVKTSILLIDRVLARRSSEILFVKVEADGFDLGAQRNPIEKNDLPEAINVLNLIKHNLNDKRGDKPSKNNKRFLLIEKEMINRDGEFTISFDRYRESVDHTKTKWPLISIADLCVKILSGGTPSTKIEKYWRGNIPWITSADIVDLKTAKPRRFITEEAIKNSATNLIPKDNIIVVTRVSLGKLFLNDFDVCISQDSQGLILNQNFVIPKYLVYVLQNEVKKFKETSQGSTIQGVTKKQLELIQIPLPPLEVQREIVEEIEGFQKIIDGARMVVDNWKPRIEVDPRMGEFKQLGEIASFIRGPFSRRLKKEIFKKDGYLIYEQYHAINDDFSFGRYYIDDAKF